MLKLKLLGNRTAVLILDDVPRMAFSVHGNLDTAEDAVCQEYGAQLDFGQWRNADLTGGSDYIDAARDLIPGATRVNLYLATVHTIPTTRE